MQWEHIQSVCTQHQNPTIMIDACLECTNVYELVEECLCDPQSEL